jgi:hypothetical protein
MVYQLPLETTRQGLSIYECVTCIYIVLHVLIPKTTSGLMTTPLRLRVDFIKCTHHIHQPLVFVGTGADPGFISKSAPTSPNYWPFRQHLRSRCSLTRSSYGGVAGQRCLQPKGISSGSNTINNTTFIYHLSA